MANTKIPVELSSTPGIVDNSNATAITIDSNEDVTVNNGTLTSSGANGVGNQGFHITDTGYSKTHKIFGDNSLHIQADSGQSILMKPNASEIARFTSHGLTFNGDTATGNALDDYEEGGWTPTLDNGGTVNTVRTATYTKVGRHVMAYTYSEFVPTNNTSIFVIGGLPYNVVNNGNYYGGGSLSYSGAEDTSSFGSPLTLYNADVIYFHYLNGSSAAVKNSQFGGRTINLILQVHYEVSV